MAYTVEFIARLRDDVSGKLKGIQGAVKNLSGEMKNSVSSLGKVAGGDLNGIAEAAAGLLGPLGAVGVGLGAVAGYAVGAAISVQQSALAFDKLSQSTGASVEFLSGFTQAADDMRISSDTVNSSLVIFSKNLVNLKGEGANVEAELMALADTFQQMPDGPQKTALAMQMFGRAGAEMIPILNEGSSAIRGMMDEAKAAGLTLSTETAAAATALAEQVDNLGDAFEGLKNRVGTGVIPALTSGIQAVSGTINQLFVQMTIADAWVKMTTGAQMTQAELLRLNGAVVEYNGAMRGSSTMTDAMVDALGGVPAAAGAAGKSVLAASADAVRAAENTRVALAMLASAEGAIRAKTAAAIKGTQAVLSSSYAAQYKAYDLQQRATLQGQYDIETQRAKRAELEQTNTVVNDANALLDEQMGLLKGVGGSAGGAATEVDKLTEAQKSLQEAQRNVGGMLSSSLGAMDELARVQTAYSLATGELSAEQFAQQQAMKALMQATKDKQVSEDKAVATALALAQGLASVSDVYAIAGPAGQRFADEQGKVQGAAEAATTKVNEMATAIKKIPNNYTVDVVATVLGMGAVQNAKKVLDDLHDRQYTAYVNVVYRQTGAPPGTGGPPGGKPAGGNDPEGPSGATGISNAKAGVAYPIGEHGPELFVPNTNGQVIPNHRLGRGGSNTPIVINLDGRTLARVVAEHLK